VSLCIRGVRKGEFVTEVPNSFGYISVVCSLIQLVTFCDAVDRYEVADCIRQWSVLLSSLLKSFFLFNVSKPGGLKPLLCYICYGTGMR